MINPEGPFGEFLKEMGIPERHSLFAAAYGKSIWGETGFRLMPLKEATSYAMQGKDLLWFAGELKRRYESVFYFFNCR